MTDLSKNLQQRALLVAPASPGSLGDEAMVSSLVEELRARSVGHLTMATWDAKDDWTRAGSFSAQVLLPRGDPLSNREFVRTLDSVGTMYTLGADVLDGAYSVEHSLIMLRAAQAGAARGLQSIIVGSSFRDDAKPEVVKFLAQMDPRVRILARDHASQSGLERITGRKPALVADIAFLLGAALESPIVAHIAEWIFCRRRINGGPVIACNLNPQPLVNAGRDPALLVASHLEAVRQLRAKFGEFSLVIVPHDRRPEHRELEIAAAFYRALPPEIRENSILLGDPLSAAEIKGVTAHVDLVLTARMHFAIAALGNGKPVACVSYHPKFDGLMAHFGVEGAVLDWREGIVPEKLAEWFGSFFSRRFEITAQVVAKLPSVLKLAAANLGDDVSSETPAQKTVNGFFATKSARTQSFGNSDVAPPRILAETTPESWGDSNGGWRRTLQLHQIIAKAGVELQFTQPTPSSSLRDYCKGLRFLWRAGFSGGCNPRLVREHGMAASRLESAMTRHTGSKLFIWEVTRRRNQAVPFLARHSGFSVVALPHNLEALAGGDSVGLRGYAGEPFHEEARALERADAVFTISSEERWLLALHGLKVGFLPYYPAESFATRFAEIRSRRSSAKPDRLLILGTVWNPPTLRGTTELIEMLRNLAGGPLLPVDIAGFGTEKLQPLVAQTAFRLHGSVNEKRLDELMLSARAVVVHQRAASGALTRIPEMLLAGIPVIANGIAARSHTHLDGVHVYETPADLHELLSRTLPVPEPPPRPARQEQQLVETLRKLLGPSAIGI